MAATFEFYYQAIRAKYEYIGPHHHQSYELVYYINGQGGTQIGNKHYTFTTGDYALIAPYTVHDERHEKQSNVIFTGFNSTTYPALQEGIFRDTKDQTVYKLMMRLAYELRDKNPYYQQMLDNIASELYLELLRAQPSQEADSRTDIIQYAKSFIDEYYMHKIEFQSLAAQSGYSYDHFRHMFKKKVGISPTNYILERRIQQAKAMLQHTNIQISAIAMECGFSTDAQFCSMFKRETGASPGQYREHCR